MLLTSKGIVQTPQELRQAEDDLLDQTGAAAVLWCGRGATALYWAYRVVGRSTSRKEVILPATSCATPANTALMAGLRPLFADVDECSGLVTSDSVSDRVTASTAAVVFIHLFGQTADLDILAARCRSFGAILIEDNAQALGAKYPNGKTVGSVGDLFVYSFCKSKILECGGGALVLRTQELAETLVQELTTGATDAGWTADPFEEAALSSSYRNLHHSLVALLRLRATPDVSRLFLSIRHHYDPLYLRPLDDVRPLAAAWKTLEAVLKNRTAKAEVYEKILRGGPWMSLDGWKHSGVCWRYSLLLDEDWRASEASEAVRRDGFHVSNLYWPLNDFFSQDDDCPKAHNFARRVMNLWVDESVDLAWVRRCARNVVLHGGGGS